MSTSVKIITDSISGNVRLPTLQLRYPKFIHGELMTHRVFSRNASSSRAIPVERLIRDVIDDPAMPVYWGKNQPGMQAATELDDTETPYTGPEGYPISEREAAKNIWLTARNKAVHEARNLHKLGAHKQIVNRIIEPWCHINVVVTSTDWNNFFALRRHSAAQPEIHELADKIFEAMESSTPKRLSPGDWHLPYVDKDNDDEFAEVWHRIWQRHKDGEFTEGACDELADRELIKLSVARCARVSYLTQDGKIPNVDEDLKLYDRLVGSVPLHASPAEHQATPDPEDIRPELHGNFTGWIQYRKTLPQERVI